MRLATLNVNHRTRPAPVPEGLVEALCGLKPDVVVLTEYVTGPDHDAFVDQMKRKGLEFAAISKLVQYKPAAWQNQVFILSRHQITDIERRSDAPEPQANTNILSVTIEGLRLVGLRAPSYEGPAWLDYWNWLGRTANGDVAIGDFNVDPTRGARRDNVLDAFLAVGDWSLVRPSGAWSYQGPSGRRSLIDHCVTAPTCAVEGARYEPSPFVGTMTDRAALLVDVVAATSI